MKKNQIKNLFFLLPVLLGCLLLFQSCGGEKITMAEIETKYGIMKVKLYNDTPNHRDNFIKLANEGFYDGTLFHRVMQNFMIQGGDPTSKGAPAGKMLGQGGPGYTLSTTFFKKIVYPEETLKLYEEIGGTPNLDMDYTVFGEVIEGIEIIDKIAAQPTNPQNRPDIDIDMKVRIIN